MEHVAGGDRGSVEAVEGDHLTQLAAGDRTSIQRFRIVVDGAEYAVGPGDSFTIPGGGPHAAVSRGDEPVVDIDTLAPPWPNPDWASAPDSE